MPCCRPAPSGEGAAFVGPATPGEVRRALAAAGELGLFFRLAEPTGGPADSEVGWRPARLLYQRDNDALDALLDAAVARLSGCERRVAASLFFQGYAARLLSPVVGSLVSAGCVPAMPADRLVWQAPETEIVRLGLVPGPGWRGPATPLVTLAVDQAFDEHLLPLAAAVRARVRISARLLRDNAASALVGALRLADHRVERGWRHLAGLALDHPALRGAGVLSQEEPAFVRGSCCLYYRVENGGMCGDCPLAGSQESDPAIVADSAPSQPRQPRQPSQPR